MTRLLGEGMDFRVFERPDGRLLRVPKRPAVARNVAREVAQLAALRALLPVAVPEAELETCDGVASIGYPRLPGSPADRVSLDAVATRRLAAEVGGFLAALHALEPAAVGAVEVPLCTEAFSPRSRLDEVVAQVGSLSALPPPLARRCERFLSGELGIPAEASDNRLIHADLEAEHLLIDPATGALTGVLDWSDFGLGDPARDLGGVWAHFGYDFMRGVLEAYGPRADPGLAQRTCFLGRCHALTAYAESRDGRIPVTVPAAVSQLERVFSGEP